MKTLCDLRLIALPSVTNMILNITSSYRISELFEIIVDYEDKTHPLPVLQDLKVRLHKLFYHIVLIHFLGMSCEDRPTKRVGERLA